jgi:hypothetical protein
LTAHHPIRATAAVELRAALPETQYRRVIHLERKVATGGISLQFLYEPPAFALHPNR